MRRVMIRSTLYRGEFMQGVRPGVAEQRSYYRLQYRQMVESLAAIAQKTENCQSNATGSTDSGDDRFADIHGLLMRSLPPRETRRVKSL